MAERDDQESGQSTSPESTQERGDVDEIAEEDSLVPPEVLESLPTEGRRKITRAFLSMTQYAGPMFNPIFRRITSEHLTKILDSTESENIRVHGSSASERKYQFAYFVLGLGAIVALLIFFAVREQYEILAAVVTGALGFGGGSGVGKLSR